MSRRSRTRRSLCCRHEHALLLLCARAVSSSLTAHAQLREPAGDLQPVLHGTTDELAGYEAVGALVTREGDANRFVCGATLIAPTVAISAAHCVSDARELAFVVANDPAAATAHPVPVRRVVQHPDYDVDLTSATVSNDLAWIVLARAPTNAQPAALGLDEVIAVGQRIQLVGFGATSLAERDIRRKNVAEARIEHTSELELVVGKGDEVQGCTGDSGGPAFVVDARGARKLVAVTSRALDPETPCRGGSVHTRVDAHRDFLAAALDAEPDAAGGCAALARSRPGRGGDFAWTSVLVFALLRAQKRRPRARQRMAAAKSAYAKRSQT